MKLIVCADAHANLPAVQAFRKDIEREGYDEVIHLGDTIDIGPYPAETVDLLLSIPRIRFVRGNHEEFFIRGIPHPRPGWMEADEEAHVRWTCAQLSPALKPVMESWPYVLSCKSGSLTATMVHYGMNRGGDDFAPFHKNPSVEDLDDMFNSTDAQVVCFGHDHEFRDVTGRKRYVNPGALGCGPRAVARYSVLTMDRGELRAEHRETLYDRSSLFAEYDRRRVPAKDTIFKLFFGRLSA